jgi:rhodanese-related sulfurtransferase
MVRDSLRRLVRGVARRMVGGSPRIPNSGVTTRTPPTTRVEWREAPEPEPEPEPDLERTAAALVEMRAAGEDIVWVDVRERHELWSGHVRGAILLPMSQLEGKAESLPDGPLLAIYCAAGARSYGIAGYLREQGRPNAWSVPEGFGGLIDAGVEWLQPATDTDWKLLQTARLIAVDAGEPPVVGQVQSIERCDGVPRLSLRTADGRVFQNLAPEDLERVGGP